MGLGASELPTNEYNKPLPSGSAKNTEPYKWKDFLNLYPFIWNVLSEKVKVGPFTSPYLVKKHKIKNN